MRKNVAQSFLYQILKLFYKFFITQTLKIYEKFLFEAEKKEKRSSEKFFFREIF